MDPHLLSFRAMDTLELGLKGKIAIVTGGSEGMGRAAAERFARSGARVAMCARRKEVLERAAEDIRKATGADLLPLAADVSRAADCEAVVAATVRQFGGVDILVNNAGTSAAAPFEKVGDDAWQADFDLKVMGAIRMSRLVIPHMKQRGGGRIINVTTVGGKAPRAQGLPTSVSRAAGINLTKSLANEYAADRILVNTICIGLVKSAQIARRAKEGDLEGTTASWPNAFPWGGWPRPASSPISWPSWPPSGPRTSPARPSTSTAGCRSRCSPGARASSSAPEVISGVSGLAPADTLKTGKDGYRSPSRMLQRGATVSGPGKAS